MTDASKNLNKGHRQRLRKRFLQNPENFYDYELLEMILFSAHSRKDTKPLAKTLLKKFGSFKKVINANPHELKNIKGLGESGIATLKIIKESFNRLLQNEIKKKILLDETEKICEYYKSKIGYLKVEQLRILYLNNKYQLVADEILSEGNIGETPIYKNKIVANATLYGAPSIILVHNHPSGDPYPSDQDLILTLNLKEILAGLEIELLDHIIVTENDSYSMQLNNFSSNEKCMSENKGKELVKKEFDAILNLVKSNK